MAASVPTALARLCRVGHVLALAALAVQLATAAVVPSAAAGWLPGAPICHAGGGFDRPAPAPSGTHDCVLCPLCQAFAQAGMVIGPDVETLAPPPRRITRIVALPPARAPPWRWASLAAYPRGPPARA